MEVPIASSRRRASSLSKVRSTSSGATVELSSCGSYIGRTHLGIRSCADNTVSQAHDGLLRFGVCGILGDEACTYDRCTSLQLHCCNLGSPGVNCLLHIVQAAHVRLLVRDGSWVLTTHLRHLPPMLHRGVSMCVSGRGVAGLGCMSASSVLLIK